MNNKSQAAGLGISIVFAIMLFISGMMAVNFIKSSVTDARTDLTCTSPASDGTKMLCLMIDGLIPYFILAILSAAGGLITYRLLI